MQSLVWHCFRGLPHLASLCPVPASGPLSETITARIQVLSLEKLVSLAEALLDFQSADDFAAWLATLQRRD